MLARDSELNRYFQPWLDTEVIAEYLIPWRIFPMEQGSHTKLKTKAFKELLRDIARDCEEAQARSDRPVGVRFVFLGKPRGDQSNCIKLLEDALEGVAYGNDKIIDYHQVTRAEFDRPKGDEVILVEILQ